MTVYLFHIDRDHIPVILLLQNNPNLVKIHLDNQNEVFQSGSRAMSEQTDGQKDRQTNSTEICGFPQTVQIDRLSVYIINLFLKVLDYIHPN